jgi:hypothetical protein
VIISGQTSNVKRKMPRRAIGKMDHQRVLKSEFKEKCSSLDTSYQVFPGKQALVYGTNQEKLTTMKAFGKGLSGSLGVIIGYGQDGREKYQTFEMRDSIPQSANLSSKGAAYFYIIAKDKTFPAFICSDKKNIQFSYYINFFYKDKPKERHPLGTNNFLANNFCKKSNRLSSIVSLGAGNDSKEIGIRDIQRPSEAICDLELMGDYVKIELPTATKARPNLSLKAKPDLIYVKVMAPVSVRASFAISFTSEKSEAIQEAIGLDAFSEAHKIALFGELKNIKPEVQRIKQKLAGAEGSGFIKINRE